MVNPHSYFDLVGYSIKNQSLFKKFELPRIIDDMCVVNNMWIDQINRNYFALVFEKMKSDGSLQLIRGNINGPALDFVGNKIPFKFQDIKSNAGLWYFPVQNKLIACTSYSRDSLFTEIGIYSINYPPNTSETIPLAVHVNKNEVFFYLAAGFVLLAGFFVWLIIRQRSHKRKSPFAIDLRQPTDEMNKALTPTHQEIPNYQMILFGGFQMFGLSNEDITNKFSPLLKELFLLILLHTLKNNKGISSEKLAEYLWFDKSDESARNNRAVNIAKLKVILTEVGGIELTQKTGYWKIICSKEEVKCDYAEFLQITGSKSNLTRQKVNRLVEIARKGAFLQNIHYEWLDDFKADVSDKIVEVLIAFADKCDLKTDAEFIIRIADCVFHFDRINEEAMILKCKAECSLGRHSLANLNYEKFTKEYLLLYNEEYKRSFNELVK
jgi:two-component SAPR family response regulator